VTTLRERTFQGGTRSMLSVGVSRIPAASGASHGAAAFVTLITGTVLSKLIWDLVPPLG
jgi:nitrate reductase alpha subunit